MTLRSHNREEKDRVKMEGTIICKGSYWIRTLASFVTGKPITDFPDVACPESLRCGWWSERGHCCRIAAFDKVYRAASIYIDKEAPPRHFNNERRRDE